MELIDIIDRDHFLRQIYPRGLKSVAVVGFDAVLNHIILSHFVLNLRIYSQPAIDIPKYGKWLTDYDAVEIELRNSCINDLSCRNWFNNTRKECSIDIKEIQEGRWSVKFYSEAEDWHLSFTVDSLIFNGCKVYMCSEEDYIPE